MKLYRVFFSIKLTKKYKENEGWSILKFRAYTVIYAEFKTLRLTEIWSKRGKTLFKALSP